MFNKAVITAKGLALDAKVSAGQTNAVFTAIKLGNGSYSDTEDLSAVTAMKSIKQTFGISSIAVIENNTVRLRSVIDNLGVEEGYYISEVGIYAQDPDYGEILYSIATGVKNKMDYQPSETELEGATSTFDTYTTISNSVNASISMGTGAMASAEDVEELRNGKVDTTGGNISETVIETLDTVEDKYPVPAAGESVKRFFGKVLTFLRNIKPLTGDINIYVSTTGSDTTGDGTVSKPFRTIQHAIDVLPKDLGGCTATIRSADGTYDETVTISGFHSGTFILRTERDSGLSSLTKVNNIICQHNTAFVLIHGYEVTTTTENGILGYDCANVQIQYIRCIGTALNKFGVYGAETNLFRVTNCEFSNKQYAVYISNSKGYIFNCTGSSNTVGISVNNASVIHLYNNSIGATTQLLQSSSGMFINPNGTQISDLVTSGLSCAWGTIQGGYRRVGNASGYAQIIVNIRITITQAMTAGTVYTINGLPLITDGVPIACTVDDTYRNRTCYLTNSASNSFIYFIPSSNLSVGWTQNFSATYITNS